MNTTQSRVAVFIDGGNFYHKLKELSIKNTSQFGYRPTIALQTHTTLSRLLIKKEIEAFVFRSVT